MRKLYPKRWICRYLNGKCSNLLALDLGVPSGRITDILNGRRSITADTAVRLGRYFGTSAEFWVNLQSLHDLHVAEAKTGKIIDQLPTLRRMEILADADLSPAQTPER